MRAATAVSPSASARRNEGSGSLTRAFATVAQAGAKVSAASSGLILAATVVSPSASACRESEAAAGSWDSTVLVWELAGRLRRHAVALPAEGRDKLWENLADADPAKAQRAMALVADAGSGVAFLEGRLKPARSDPARTKQIARLIADLDSDTFEVRERAGEALGRMGEAAGPYLRAALKRETALEPRRRMEALVAALDSAAPSAGGLRELRVVELLERVGTAEARRVLRSLAGGDAVAELTREAKVALGRLAKVRGQAE
jgi:hypothetical protein